MSNCPKCGGSRFRKNVTVVFANGCSTPKCCCNDNNGGGGGGSGSGLPEGGSNYDLVTKINGALVWLSLNNFPYIQDLEQQITTILNSITGIEGDITTIINTLSTLQGNITDINNDITNINNDITTINSAITTINSSITQLQNDLNTAEQDIDDLQTQSELFQQHYNYYLDLITASLEEYGLDWINISQVPPALTGLGTNGGAINLVSRAIGIPAGQTGVGTNLSEVSNLNIFPTLKIGDKVKVRLTLSEVFANTLNDTIDATILINGQAYTGVVDREYHSEGYITDTFEHTVLTLNDEITRTYIVNSNSQVTGSDRTFYWVDTSIIYDEEIFNQYKVDSILYIKRLITLWNDRVRYAVYSQCVANGIADDTAMLQEEINRAIATSRILMLKEGTYRITGNVNITEYIEIKGIARSKTFVYGDSNTGVFVVNSIRGPILSDFTFTRNPSTLPTAIVFGTTLTALNTRIVRVNFMGITTGIVADFCDGLLLDSCVFDAGITRPLLWGSQNAYSAKNLKIVGCTFTSINTFVFEIFSVNNIIIEDNLFNSTTSTFADMIVRVRILTDGANDFLSIRRNRFYGFEGTACYIVTAASVGITLSNIIIDDNIFDDKSASTISDSITLSGGPGNITKVSIRDNVINNKNYGIYTNYIAALTIKDNTIIGVTGTSKPISINNGTFRLGTNYISNQQSGFERALITGASRVTDSSAATTINYTIPSLAAKASVSVSVTVPGANTDRLARSSFSLGLNGRMINSNVESNDTVVVTFFNPTDSTIAASGSGLLFTRVEFNI